MERPRALVVEGDDATAEQLSAWLSERVGLEVVRVRDGEAGYNVLDSTPVSVVGGFTTSIRFQFTSPFASGADGLALVLHNDPRGTNALGWEGPGFSTDDLALTRMWLGANATTIYGGSSEIQRNIIAKRVLKLPTNNQGGN